MVSNERAGSFTWGLCEVSQMCTMVVDFQGSALYLSCNGSPIKIACFTEGKSVHIVWASITSISIRSQYLSLWKSVEIRDAFNEQYLSVCLMPPVRLG